MQNSPYKQISSTIQNSTARHYCMSRLINVNGRGASFRSFITNAVYRCDVITLSICINDGVFHTRSETNVSLSPNLTFNVSF